MSWLDKLMKAPVSGDETAEEKTREFAVVMVGEVMDCFVFGRGPIIESDKECGLGADECGPTSLVPNEKGLWIWEGTPGWHEGYGPDGGEPIYEGMGTWRRPTATEAHKIMLGDFTLFGPERLRKTA